MSQNEPIFYRRNLPHIHPQEACFFVTFRLADSLPADILQKLRQQKEDEMRDLRNKYNGEEFDEQKHKVEKRYFGHFDEWLDRASTGPQWLKEKHIAQIVADKIHELHGKRYNLIAYCIMSNHVHLLFDTTGINQSSAPSNTAGKTRSYPVADAMRLLQGSTSRFCNLTLNRTGAFWHKESYDHYVCNDDEHDEKFVLQWTKTLMQHAFYDEKNQACCST